MIFDIQDSLNTKFEEKMNSSFYFIEATDFERMTIINKHKDLFDLDKNYSGDYKLVGYINNEPSKPIYLCFRFNKILDSLVCFYNPTSRYVDYNIVEKWLRKNFCKKDHLGQRIAITDAMNSHMAIHEALEIKSNNDKSNDLLKNLKNKGSNIKDDEIPEFIKSQMLN